MDIKETFKLLAQRTHPYGSESELLKYLTLNKDSFGNYYLIVGSSKPTTMFCCHFDTFGDDQTNVNIKEYQDFIFTDGGSILGADDKAGIVLLMYMIENNVSGLYYFFIGEESGSIGSKVVSSNFDTISYMKDLKRCIAFDRRGISSVITQQSGVECCSRDFANRLIMHYNRQGISLKKDNTGIFCDSGSFIGKMECTNISVGYYNEHTTDEILNIRYLDMLCKASIKIKWNDL